MSIDDAALSRLKQVVGARGVVEGADRDRYEHDFRRQYAGSTPLVLRPASTEEVSRVLAICHERRIGVVPHGGNTSYCGGATPDESGSQVVLSLERMNRVRAVDPLNDAITVEAGCILADVQAAAERAGRLFPLSLGSEGSCQIGGNLSTNAGGTAVLRYGMMRDLVLGLEVVLADGRVLDALRGLRKDNRGYDLKQLFIGAEGTLGVITAATLELFAPAASRATALCAVPVLGAAVDLLSHVRTAAGEWLTTFELMPRIAVQLATRHIPGVRDPFANAHPWYVLIELTASRATADTGEALESALQKAQERAWLADAVIATSETQRESMWKLRETIPEAQRHEGASLKHDVSVPIAVLVDFVAQAQAWVQDHVPEGVVVSYGHLGDGNLHFNVNQRSGTQAFQLQAVEQKARRAIHDLVREFGGSFSAEHGIGRAKVQELERYKAGVELDLMRTLKRSLDPHGILNPGKVLR
ncbi:MAG TPA: FAD-binding oxidoreductase [Steroidobacteraceae bacterium]|nr:FAD-binding oxidoreductase [Steroidobacteraceae bacterium]